jgi:hypothetical protein
MRLGPPGVLPFGLIRLFGLLGLLTLSVSCGRTPDLFRQYEYEEETYLSLDGTATIHVNASVAALNQLRGAPFDTKPEVRPDTASVSAFFNAPGVRVTRVTFSTRNERLYLHVRMDVDDVRGLAQTRPFGWSTYTFGQDGDLIVYRQRVGAPVAAPSSRGSWEGGEIVAFRMHIPSKVAYHNAEPDNLKRGNILVWEQSLADRLAGVPLEIEGRMENQSILYRALGLFAAMIALVGAMFALILWWIVRRQKRRVA